MHFLINKPSGELCHKLDNKLNALSVYFDLSELDSQLDRKLLMSWTGS